MRKNKRNRQVMQIDPSSQVLEKLPVQEAIQKIWQGKAISVEDSEDNYFGPPNELGIRWAMPVPVTICLVRTVHKPDKSFDPVMAGRRQILDRDNWTCGYCGRFGSTLDHVVPQSKGGQNTWYNLITACEECNHLKADMDLSEFEREYGAKLLWQPYVPDPNKLNKDQMLVWEKISRGEIEMPDELE